MTPRDKATLNTALTEIQTLRQTIGILGHSLRRTKPGSKRHRKYWDQLTKLEADASEKAAMIRMFFETGLVCAFKART